MMRIEAYIRVGALEAVQRALLDAGVPGMSFETVRGYGRHPQPDTGQAPNDQAALAPRLRIDVVVRDQQLEAALDAIVSATQSGNHGDGKIFVSEVTDAIRIRTGDRGEPALE